MASNRSRRRSRHDDDELAESLTALTAAIIAGLILGAVAALILVGERFHKAWSDPAGRAILQPTVKPAVASAVALALMRAVPELSELAMYLGALGGVMYLLIIGFAVAKSDRERQAASDEASQLETHLPLLLNGASSTAAAHEGASTNGSSAVALAGWWEE